LRGALVRRQCRVHQGPQLPEDHHLPDSRRRKRTPSYKRRDSLSLSKNSGRS
jgi:hypothetical protein